MELLDKYNDLRQEVFDYFGYCEDWRVLPLDDARENYWRLTEDEVLFGAEEDVRTESGDHYVNEIYRQRHLPKWVYRGADYTMVVVDTHTDGNQFLQIFDNSKERP